MADTAKVFMVGDNQAVLLPDAYRFNTDEVTIERAPDGAVVLRPLAAANLGEHVQRVLANSGDAADFERPEQGALERDAPWWDQQTR